MSTLSNTPSPSVSVVFIATGCTATTFPGFTPTFVELPPENTLDGSQLYAPISEPSEAAPHKGEPGCGLRPSSTVNILPSGPSRSVILLNLGSPPFKPGRFSQNLKEVKVPSVQPSLRFAGYPLVAGPET